jgi:uncharacterized repeat protein (TIGR01451 family)
MTEILPTVHHAQHFWQSKRRLMLKARIDRIRLGGHLFINIVLVIALVGSSGASGAASMPWESKVDPALLHAAAESPVEFLVFLNEQADLSEAHNLPTKREKGEYVFRRLTETARRTQGSLLAALDQIAARSPAGLDYRQFWVVNAVWVRAGAGASSDAIAQIAARPDVAHIYANTENRLELPEEPAQPRIPDQTEAIEANIQKVRAPLVWAQGYTGQGAVIGGQDTGYDWDHPALKGKYRGWDGSSANHNYNWHDAIHSGGGICGPDSPVPCDDGFHGTHTMGIMVGDDGLGHQIGVAPGARWIGCRNMNVNVGSVASYTECYEWFIAPTDLQDQNPRPDLAPDVINNSWSCPPSPLEDCDDPNVLKQVVENVRAAGIVTVHSAGNDGFQGCGSIDTPAAIYDASFTVGATENNDVIAGFSSRGPVEVDGSNRLKPDVSAPGVSVRSSEPSTGSQNNYGIHSGTSMAAPHVAGLVALLLSAYPQLSGRVDEIEWLITQSAVPRTISQICGGVPGSQVPNNSYGWGRVDAWNAIYNSPRWIDLSKSVSDITYDPGEIITYTLQLTYPHPITPTHNLVITDIVPLDTSFITATLPHTRTGDTVVWGLPVFGPNQTLELNLVVQVSPTADLPIYNQDYSASSDDIERVYGIPVPIFRAIYYYFPWLPNQAVR